MPNGGVPRASQPTRSRPAGRASARSVTARPSAMSRNGPAASPPGFHQVALLSHASFLYEDLTAAQNLIVLGRLLGLADPAKDAAALLDRVGLTARTDNPVRQFSAGMRKRVAVARLLLKAPSLALLDEPFGELDPQGIAQMESLIGELKAKGTTLVLATHQVDQGLKLTEERLHLENGRITVTT